MVHDGPNWRMKTRRAALILSAALLPLLAFAASAVHAQSIMRTPNLNVGSRMPTINPTVAPRINPNIAGSGAERGADHRRAIDRGPRIGVKSTLPYARYSPNLYPACQHAYRDADGECLDRPVDVGRRRRRRRHVGQEEARQRRARNNARPRSICARSPNEFVAEIDGALSDAQADELARRHGLARVASQNFPLIGGTIGLFRIADRRPVETVRREFAADASVRSVQPNFRYLLQDQKTASTEGDPAQYARREAPAAAGAHAGPRRERHHRRDRFRHRRQTSRTRQLDRRQFRRARQQAKARMSTAPALPARSSRMRRLMGSAPEAQDHGDPRLRRRHRSGAESTSYVILKGLNYAAEHGAQIINMSFAGPKDPLIERGIAATAAQRHRDGRGRRQCRARNRRRSIPPPIPT